MTNKLTPELLMKLEQDLNKKKFVNVKTRTGEIIEIEMYENLRDTLIERAYLNFTAMLAELEQRTIIDDELLVGACKCYPFFLVKEIANLPNVPTDPSIEQAIALSRLLTDLHIIKGILDSLSKEDKKLIEKSNNAMQKEIGKQLGELFIKSRL